LGASGRTGPAVASVTVKRSLEAVGFLMVVAGLAGMVHHFVGWFRFWGFLRRVELFREHDIAANVGLIVLGAAILVVTDVVGKRYS
jgi:hypothetical protein